MKKYILPFVILILSGCSTLNSTKEFNSQNVYKCSNNTIITAHYYTKGNSALVDITLPNKESYTLVNVIAASGAKYNGDIYEWWSKGNKVTLTNLMESEKINCES